MASQFKRGDIVLVPFPYVSDYTRGKVRPALVISNDIANAHSPNLILALISSTVPSKRYPMHHWIEVESPEGQASGLDRDSIVKSEVIITIPKGVVVKRIGHLPPSAMRAVDDCLRISLSL